MIFMNTVLNKVDFLFSIDKDNDELLVTQIYQKVKEEILNGTMKYGDVLPSIRKASASLGVSKITVITAYLQLVTEGYIENRPQRGYFVCKVERKPNEPSLLEWEFREQNISFVNDSIDEQSFSKSLWKKYYNRVLFDPETDLTHIGDEQGEYALRSAISNYVRMHRGSNCTPEQVIISSGVQSLVDLLIKLTQSNFNSAVLESPGYKKVEYVFEDARIPIHKIPVGENGLNIQDIHPINHALIYVSPGYQYPLGKVMTIDKRLELIQYAKENSCLIIEDDYASTIRYEAKPISSLQGLDGFGNTVYIGSFSKTFLPSLRISFMVLPKKLVKKYFSIKAKYTHQSSKLEQLALAQFIFDGQMEKHLKRINKIYKQKNLFISSYIKQNYANQLKIINNESGFHMVFRCHTQKDQSVVQDFHNELLSFEIIDLSDGVMTFLFNYSGLTLEEIPWIIDTMVQILNL